MEGSKAQTTLQDELRSSLGMHIAIDTTVYKTADSAKSPGADSPKCKKEKPLHCSGFSYAY